MKSKKFLTEYWVGDERFCSHIFAEGHNEAIQLSRLRGLGELVIGESEEHNVSIPDTLFEQLHLCCFLSWICMNSNILKPEYILGDKGILHEIAHRIDGTNNNEIRHRIDHLCRITPGQLPL
jgi:hypothetical protein